jgi:hypothetical protein
MTTAAARFEEVSMDSTSTKPSEHIRVRLRITMACDAMSSD